MESIFYAANFHVVHMITESDMTMYSPNKQFSYRWEGSVISFSEKLAIL